MNHYQAPPDLLHERVILVTGAGQGLGRAVAIACATHGATVILHGRKVAKLEKTFDAIVAAGTAEPVIFPLDLETATDKDFAAMAQAIGEQLGRLDGIVHCAARLTTLTPLAQQSLDDWQSLLRVNLVAPFALTRACLPLLARAPDASIVFTSETHGHQPAAYWGGFSVSKWGLEALVRIWDQELELTPQIRANVLVPGPVATPQRAATHPGEAKTRLPAPEQLAPSYLYLLGGQSRQIRGQVITVGDAQAAAAHFGLSATNG